MAGFVFCAGCPGPFAGQARSHKNTTAFRCCEVPVGAGLSREEAGTGNQPASAMSNP